MKQLLNVLNDIDKKTIRDDKFISIIIKKKINKCIRCKKNRACWMCLDIIDGISHKNYKNIYKKKI